MFLGVHIQRTWIWEVVGWAGLSCHSPNSCRWDEVLAVDHLVLYFDRKHNFSPCSMSLLKVLGNVHPLGRQHLAKARLQASGSFLIVSMYHLLACFGRNDDTHFLCRSVQLECWGWGCHECWRRCSPCAHWHWEWRQGDGGRGGGHEHRQFQQLLHRQQLNRNLCFTFQTSLHPFSKYNLFRWKKRRKILTCVSVAKR